MQDRKLDARQSSAAGLPCSPSGEDFKRKRNCGAFAAGNEQAITIHYTLYNTPQLPAPRSLLALAELETTSLDLAWLGGRGLEGAPGPRVEQPGSFRFAAALARRGALPPTASRVLGLAGGDGGRGPRREEEGQAGGVSCGNSNKGSLWLLALPPDRVAG